jgi:hypothetical protein
MLLPWALPRLSNRKNFLVAVFISDRCRVRVGLIVMGVWDQRGFFSDLSPILGLYPTVTYVSSVLYCLNYMTSRGLL